ncbi:MAG: hybrid sensor histidine kinase/response regulator [Magnetococcales bacterium]|nr:hybrid sensor histidine kinase/response regulator [Magnetococcales bacterium]
MSEESEKILIVDDEKINIDILVELLGDDYKIVVAKNGEQALKRANTTPRPDLILLDIMMPDIDGFEVCSRLKSDEATSAIPIIFITGKDSTQDETRGLELGAVDFIRKPFNPTVTLARIQTHLMLQRQKKRLLELNELKNTFIGMAAHDLRNPLSSISGLSEILLSIKLTEEEKQEFIQNIYDVSNQMLTLINDLLDVSLIESGRFVLDARPASLVDLVTSRVQLMRFIAEKKGVFMITDLHPVPQTSIDWDRMAQVVDNLISNAIKFTPSNSEITVSTGQQKDRIFFQVRDQGPGIPDEERHRLFGVFQKLSVRPTDHEKSTGLGLSIVKKIVDSHHGEIEVVNGSDCGAIFTCYLPV